MTTETKPDYELAKEELTELFKRTVKHEVQINGPMPVVRDDWPCMHYLIIINGVPFEFSLGVGHAKMERFKGREWKSCMLKYHLSGDEIIGLQDINDGRTLKDHNRTESIACKVGRDVKPYPAEAVASVCREYMDTQDAGDFEEWAATFGYDTDSRKAEQIYRQCVDGLGKLKRIGLTMAQIKQFAEISSRL